MRKLRVVAVCLGMIGAIALVVPASAKPAGDGDRARNPLDVYVGVIDHDQVEEFRGIGLDHEDVRTAPAGAGKVKVEAVLSEVEASRLASRGVKLSVKLIRGQKASDALRKQGLAGNTVYRSYSEAGGLRQELEKIAADNPSITKLLTIGHTTQGKPIKGIKLTRGARLLPDGLRPAVVYVGAQHAREWITPEMVRRLLHHFIDGYGSNPELTNLVNTREMYFFPVINPDGYDFTFTEGNRLWRKNLRDNNGDGVIAPGDGVDPNRNYAYKWGYDNEGSSIDPASETYRGPGPNSEPESKALDGFFKRLRPEFFVNYHSAAELLLYGVGWQVSTPTPDDVISITLAGDDANPAVPGYDPDISAELYTTNGDTDSHMTEKYGSLGFTPEMTTCETVSNSIPDDEWVAEDCASGFNFPDDEELIQAEFAKNIPFALSLAKSAAQPDNPVSVVGRTSPDFVVDAFDVSYGRTQPVAAIIRRALKNVKVHWKVNGGSVKSASVKEWQGGERYGDENDDYYAEFRGKVTNTKPGDQVEVWFSGFSVTPGRAGAVSSDHFTYRVHDDIGGKVLILAAEDVTGVSPAQGVTSAKYAADYASSLSAAGYSSDVYDFDTQGRKAPHHLGVLSHYKAIVWETGDDIILRSTGQPGGTTAKAALDIELSVRDYLNEGGKLLLTGQNALFAQSADGSYFYNPDAPAQPECTVREYPCLPVLNDFLQYYLGAYNYVSGGGTDGTGEHYPVGGTTGAFDGFAGTLNGAGSAANQTHTASFLTTSSFLPPAQFPQFASAAPSDWLRPGAAPFDPRTGDWYLYSDRSDQSFKRLSRTVDLTSATSGELRFWSSFDTEPNWDFFVVEARAAGTDTWTTLADSTGHTTQETGDSCASGWVDGIHPFLAHYQGADCSPAGTTGAWHALTGPSGGWTELAYDLTPYAGQQVELSISYISDWGTQGLGVFLDDVSVSANGAVVTQTSFEDGLGGWTVGTAAGSPSPTNNWVRSQQAFEEGSIVTTRDTVFTGFGAEGLTPAQRDDLVKRSLAHLLGY
ncbi:M14 family metallopeptidase [Catellatospora bangladeshensis]|uniref:Zinc carboxypeptidase n=1 Tax=Catellatospora bangladeshensis TaxID=310355 RepID=A0A8J3NM72_9ACTN|nr:M14 family metallopeptidase [Catellatospora bangladeshensis]GIF84778.1 zinc carboxypeptidase [Catellatospora bangladeshensis]